MLDRSKDFDIVCIGHICHDLINGGHKTGGAVYFASLVAIKRGKKVCVLSSIAIQDLSLQQMRNMGVVVKNQGSKYTTCFRNQYANNRRIQFLPRVADRLRTDWVLDNMPSSKAVFICPIADEIDVGILEKIDSVFLACSIQGWLRERRENGKIVSKSIKWEKLKFADVIFLSYEDIKSLDGALEELCRLDNIIVVTDAEKGADVFIKGTKRHFPSIPTKVTDPTGAGDTFATAFIISYLHDKNLNKSIRYAHKAASELIGKQGM